jgi:ribosomal protein S18 acetylase RimI-like enzyme
VTGYLIRPATEADLDALAGFEVEIAQVSFGDEAITDPALHRKRVAGALGKPGEVTVVAAADSEPDVPVGWAWLSGRTNSLTGARYGTQLTGKVHARNLGMRALYRKFGFEATHITMEKRDLCREQS